MVCKLVLLVSATGNKATRPIHDNAYQSVDTDAYSVLLTGFDPLTWAVLVVVIGPELLSWQISSLI